MKISFTSKATSDVDFAYIYYENIVGKELADRFFSAIVNRTKILASPDIEIGNRKYLNTKKVKNVSLKNFPYIIFFRRDDKLNELLIVRVLHKKRDLDGLL